MLRKENDKWVCARTLEKCVHVFLPAHCNCAASSMERSAQLCATLRCDRDDLSLWAARLCQGMCDRGLCQGMGRAHLI